MNDLFLCLNAVKSALLLVVFRDLHCERRMNFALSLHELINLLLIQIQEVEKFTRQKALSFLWMSSTLLRGLSNMSSMLSLWHSRVALSAELDLIVIIILTQTVAKLTACLLPNFIANARTR